MKSAKLIIDDTTIELPIITGSENESGIHITKLRNTTKHIFSLQIITWSVTKINSLIPFTVCHVKNITDVGHMRQEMLETGGDKVILEALKNKSNLINGKIFINESF